MKGLEAALKRIGSLHGTQVTVGIQGSVASGSSTLPELVQIATVNEFGLGHIPARPFLRTSLRIKGPRWIKGLRRAVAQIARGEVQASALTLRRVGAVAVGDVQATMRDHAWVPNAQATVDRKGSDKPLIDTGQLRQSIRAAVEVPGRDPEVVA